MTVLWDLTRSKDGLTLMLLSCRLKRTEVGMVAQRGTPGVPKASNCGNLCLNVINTLLSATPCG